MKLQDILQKDARHRYMMLSRWQEDIKYFFGCGNMCESSLWWGAFFAHLAAMRAVYRSLPDAPEWISLEEIDGYVQEYKERTNKK